MWRRRRPPVEVKALYPVRLSLLPGVAVVARWEVTCGFCGTRFQRVILELMVGSSASWVGCPACGTHNLLPHHPKLRDRGL